MDTDKVTMEQLVAFAILMENDEGIMGKAPSYIREKFHSCMSFNNPTSLEGLLDRKSLYKLQQWRQLWT